MEVGTSRPQSSLRYSDEILYCGLCGNAGSNTPREASGYCKACRKFMCKTCLRNHTKQVLSHEIIQGDSIYDVKKEKPVGLPFQYCDQHREQLLENYCEDHERLLCDVCLYDEHWNCKNVEQISILCRGIKRNQHVQAMSNDILHLRTKIDDLQQTKMMERSKIIELKKQCIDDIGCLKREIDMFFAQLERKMNSDVDNTFASHTESISKHVKNLDEAKKSLESDIKNLKTAEILENEEQIFTAVKLSRYKSIKETFDIIESDRSITMMQFSPHEKVRDLLDNLQSLGQIDISHITRPSGKTFKTQKADHSPQKSEKHVDLRRRKAQPLTSSDPKTCENSQSPVTERQEHKDPNGKKPQPSTDANTKTGENSQPPATKTQEHKGPIGKNQQPSTGVTTKMDESSQPPATKTQEHSDPNGMKLERSLGAKPKTGEGSQPLATKTQEHIDPDGKKLGRSLGAKPKTGEGSQPLETKTQEHSDPDGKKLERSLGAKPKTGEGSQPLETKTQEHSDPGGKKLERSLGAKPKTGEGSQPLTTKTQEHSDPDGKKLERSLGAKPKTGEGSQLPASKVTEHRDPNDEKPQPYIGESSQTPASTTQEHKGPNDVKEQSIVKQGEFTITDSSGFDIAIISGAVFLPNEELVLCDNLNDSMKLLDRNHKLKSSVKVPGGLYGVAVVSDGELLVTRPGARGLQYFFVSERGVLTPGRQIKVGRMCCGIHVHKQKIYVTCHDNPGNGEVVTLTHGGKMGKRFGRRQDGTFMFARPDAVALSPQGDRIFVSDWEGNHVICLTRNGDPLFTYTDPALRGPEGLFVKSNGEVIVCGGSSRNLHVIARDGRQSDVIPIQDKGFPVSVAYRSRDGKIVVGFENSTVMTEY